MFDLPIPLGEQSSSQVKLGRRTRHRIEVLEEGPRKRPLSSYLSLAAGLIGAAAGYYLYSSGISQSLPILLIACLVLLYLR